MKIVLVRPPSFLTPLLKKILGIGKDTSIPETAVARATAVLAKII